MHLEFGAAVPQNEADNGNEDYRYDGNEQGQMERKGRSLLCFPQRAGSSVRCADRPFPAQGSAWPGALSGCSAAGAIAPASGKVAGGGLPGGRCGRGSADLGELFKLRKKIDLLLVPTLRDSSCRVALYLDRVGVRLILCRGKSIFTGIFIFCRG